MPITEAQFSLHMGPPARGAPDDLTKPLLAVVEGARESVDLATQQLEARPLVDALIAAERRGVQVRCVLENDYLRERTPSAEPWQPAGLNEANREVLSAFLRARVPVRIERASRLQHSNFIVIDAGGEEPSVVTTSANLTPSGLETNLNHALTMTDPLLAASLRAEFDALWEDTSASPHDAVPPQIERDGIETKLVFGPEHAPEMEVMKQIEKAREEVVFAMFSFSSTSGVDDALIAARHRGVAVRGALDANQAGQAWAATHNLKEAGVELHIAADQADPDAKLHHKTMVCDRRTLIAGTFNFSESARFNEEMLVVLSAAEDHGDLASCDYAREEIDRIIAENATPLL